MFRAKSPAAYRARCYLWSLILQQHQYLSCLKIKPGDTSALVYFKRVGVIVSLTVIIVDAVVGFVRGIMSRTWRAMQLVRNEVAIGRSLGRSLPGSSVMTTIWR